MGTLASLPPIPPYRSRVRARPAPAMPPTPLTPLTAAIALGSNLGDRAATLRSAASAIEQLPGVRLIAVGSFHETAAVPVPHDPGAGPPSCVLDETVPRRRPASLRREPGHGRDVPHRGQPVGPGVLPVRPREVGVQPTALGLIGRVPGVAPRQTDR